jgi:hypothetical protein
MYDFSVLFIKWILRGIIIAKLAFFFVCPTYYFQTYEIFFLYTYPILILHTCSLYD